MRVRIDQDGFTGDGPCPPELFVLPDRDLLRHAGRLTISPRPGFVRSKRGWITALALLLVASACAGTSRGEPLVLTEDLDMSLQAALDASIDGGGLPGAQAAVVFHDGTVWSGAVGEDITTETQFAIGSITKLFTATAILRMAERGELSLDDKVAAWLPDEEVDGRVTIRQVLSHTSGLVRDGEDEIGPEHAASICAPGTCVSYSNVGYSLLGRVIEAVTDDTVARAYHTEILDQLSLSSTVLGTQEEVLGPLAVGHYPGGVLEPADITVRWTDPSGEVNIGSAGAIVSNARDVAAFAAGLFRGQLLELQTMTEMLDFDTYADLDGADECGARGLGVLRQSADTEFGLAWGHNGIVNGFTAAVRYYPGYDIAIAVLVNSSGIGGGAQGTEEALASLLLADTTPIDPDHGRGKANAPVNVRSTRQRRMAPASNSWSMVDSPHGLQGATRSHTPGPGRVTTWTCG